MSNDKQFIDFKKEVEKLKEIDGAEEYAKQLAHLFLGNGLSLQTILLMAIDFGQQHPHWIPVEEELPPRQSALSHCSSNVMAGFFGGAGNYVCGAFYDHKEKKWFDSDDDKPLDADGEYRVTHWMTIVPPRKEE